MSQPILEIYQYEKWLAMAVASVMLANGLNDPAKQQDDGSLKAPRVEIKVVTNGMKVPPNPAPHVWIKQDDGTHWADARTGTLFLKVVTRRGAEPDQDHYGILGTARWVVETKRADITSKLPWHGLAHIEETGITPTFDDGQQHDITTLSYNFTMRILFEQKKAQIFIA